jgi:hypothetical protein
VGRLRLLRELRRGRDQRERQLRDLGALVFELHRDGRREPERLRRMASELTELERELRALEAALRDRRTGAGEGGGEPSGAAARATGATLPAGRRLLAGMGALVAAGLVGWAVTGGLGGGDEPQPEPTLASRSAPAIAEPQAPPAATEEPREPRRKPGLRAWPAGVRAHTVVLVTSSDERAARVVAKEALASGLEAGMLRAEEFGLGQGLFVVFAGRYQSREQAGVRAARLAERYPGAYPELIERSQ